MKQGDFVAFENADGAKVVGLIDKVEPDGLLVRRGWGAHTETWFVLHGLWRRA